MPGDIMTPWPGIFSAIADQLYEMAGTLLGRTIPSQQGAGLGSLLVESTDAFPDAGRLAVAGVILNYTSKTPSQFDGITDEDGNPGLPVDVPPRSVVADISRLNTQFDDLRASFIVTTAEDRELDILGRNYGLNRPRGLPDVQWGPLLQALIYIEAQTIYACEQVLDILWPGQYTLYEDLESFPHTVFVGIPAGGSGSFTGKAWLIGGEPQPRTGALTVDVDNPVQLVYGVYDSNDPDRTGTNYALEDLAITTDAGSPQTLTTAGSWQPSDDGKPVIITTFAPDNTPWVMTFIDVNNVEIQSRTRDDGTADGATPTIFTTDFAWFAPWINNVPVELVIPAGLNMGIYPVTSRLSGKQLQIAGALVTETDISWYLRPVLPTGGSFARVQRATAAGNTITIPASSGPLPLNVLVDYTHVPSAQALIDFNAEGEDQYPFYLWDDGAITQQILDLITAAGVRVVLVPE